MIAEINNMQWTLDGTILADYAEYARQAGISEVSRPGRLSTTIYPHLKRESVKKHPSTA